MSFRGWKPYVPVAKRREQAAKKLAKLQKTKGTVVTPVPASRTIAASFWGKSWCDNLERYSDYANRMPRGRTYVRNGSVVDLQVAEGLVTAKVAGSELYSISIAIAPVAQTRWTALAKDCSGSIDSVVELLQGRLAKGVMDRVCRQGDGLFPAPKEIKLSCSCPDWADMCKHVAAALYGVGSRLDEQPELLFLLRGVDKNDLIASAGAGMGSARQTVGKGKVLADDNMAALFGLDLVEDVSASTEAARTTAKPIRPRTSKAAHARDVPVPAKTSGSRVRAKSTQKAGAPKASAAQPPTPAKKSLSRPRA
jgi:uncharacterized Zn finger protein